MHDRAAAGDDVAKRDVGGLCEIEGGAAGDGNIANERPAGVVQEANTACEGEGVGARRAIAAKAADNRIPIHDAEIRADNSGAAGAVCAGQRPAATPATCHGSGVDDAQARAADARPAIAADAAQADTEGSVAASPTGDGGRTCQAGAIRPEGDSIPPLPPPPPWPPPPPPAPPAMVPEAVKGPEAVTAAP